MSFSDALDEDSVIPNTVNHQVVAVDKHPQTLGKIGAGAAALWKNGENVEGVSERFDETVCSLLVVSSDVAMYLVKVAQRPKRKTNLHKTALVG